MQLFNRQNVLDLIGSSGYKYRSCILTCYSYDFSFFEERIMSILRSANIKNVNVFLDGHFLNEVLEKTTGHEFRTHRTYSLTPIYSSGVFHPKIMLLTGVKHGLLLIGSGNLTSAGLGTNDEIWGAFHLDSVESANAPIFAEIWKYLKQIISSANGFIKTKINWISQFSPWLEELIPPSPGVFVKLQDDQEVAFLGSRAEFSIFQNLIFNLPQENPQAITIISPFYDKGGLLIQQLSVRLNPKIIHCVVDLVNGSLPMDLDAKIAKEILFFQWEKCRKEAFRSFNRLHAKLIHFQFLNDEYLLIGSANASIQAFGGPAQPAINTEACLLIRRSSSNSYLRDLAIDLSPESAISFSDIRNLGYISKVEDHVRIQKNQRIRISYTELLGDQLSFFIIEDNKEILDLKILNPWEEEIFSTEIQLSSNKNIVRINILNEPFKICLCEKNNARISNFALIHQTALQAKCNPDPGNEGLSGIIEILMMDPDGAEYASVFNYVDFNQFEDEAELVINSNKNAGTREYGIIAANKSYKTLTEKEFYALQTTPDIPGLVYNGSVQIADLFSGLVKGFSNTNEKVQESSEQALLLDNKQIGDGDEVEIKLLRKGSDIKEYRAVRKFVKKLSEFYSVRLTTFFECPSLATVPRQSLTIKDLSNMLIGLHVIHVSLEKKFEVCKTLFTISNNHASVDLIKAIESKYKLERIDKFVKKNLKLIFYKIDTELFMPFQEEIAKIKELQIVDKLGFSQETSTFPFFEKGQIKDGPNTIKGYIMNVVGSYNLLSTSGFRIYPFESLNLKIKDYRQIIFQSATYLILSIDWKPNETEMRDVLLLDLLHFTFTESSSVDMSITRINRLIESFTTKNKKSRYYHANLHFYKTNLLVRYIAWNGKFISPVAKIELKRSVPEINNGEMIFSSRIGFNRVFDNDRYLVLEKPAYQNIKQTLTLPFKTYTNEAILFGPHI